MPKRLLVVESPGKVKKLTQILGSDWIVKASCGHIRELSDQGEDSLGFSIEGNSVRCNYIPHDQRAKETIGQLKAAVKLVEEVVLATDPDREGETIAWHLKEVLGLREPLRIVYTEITASAVTSAIALSEIASQCRAAVLRKTQVITQSGNLLWKATGQIIQFYGYAKYWNNLSTALHKFVAN